MTPKEKVRANIYKSLLEEEKRKGKKMSYVSLSLFVVGIFAGTSYETIKNNIIPTEQFIAFKSKSDIETNFSKKESDFKIDDLFKTDEIKIKKRDFDSENFFVTDLQI